MDNERQAKQMGETKEKGTLPEIVFNYKLQIEDIESDCQCRNSLCEFIGSLTRHSQHTKRSRATSKRSHLP
ncbi:hypothetical protein BC835DRAFT_1362052 [Cytidiella melzeri]|nr:hypothetical protein BC835DRAFT_1362052 [Cytidiella melzeri]